MTVGDCVLNFDAEPGFKGQKSDSQRMRSRLNDPSMRSQLISGPSEFKEGVTLEIFVTKNTVNLTLKIAFGSHGSRARSPGCVADFGPGNSGI